MSGSNFTYGSKVTFRYYLQPLWRHLVVVTAGRICVDFTSTSMHVSVCLVVRRASCLRSHTSSSVWQVSGGAGRHLSVTRSPAGTLRLVSMLTTPSRQTLTSQGLRTLASRVTGMINDFCCIFQWNEKYRIFRTISRSGV